MKEINEYQKRFNQLMESTIGNVKPLVTEQLKPKSIPVRTPINPRIGLSGKEPAKVEDKIITVTPKITINCTKQVITNSDLPKLEDITAEVQKNESIIYQYCPKK